MIIQTTDDVYENLKDYNPTKKRKVLVVFYDLIKDMESNKKLSPIVTAHPATRRRSDVITMSLCTSQ